MIYKVRVILDAKNSVFRDILIKEKQSLWNLHMAVKDAFSLPGEDLSSFYYTDEDWTEGQAIPLEDMSDDGDGETMSDIYISEAFPKDGAKMIFKYGLIDLWEFFCELQEKEEEKSGVKYPHTAFRFGNAPLKAPITAKDLDKTSKRKTTTKPKREEVLEETEEEDYDINDFDDIEDIQDDLGFESEELPDEGYDDEV